MGGEPHKILSIIWPGALKTMKNKGFHIQKQCFLLGNTRFLMVCGAPGGVYIKIGRPPKDPWKKTDIDQTPLVGGLSIQLHTHIISLLAHHAFHALHCFCRTIVFHYNPACGRSFFVSRCVAQIGAENRPKTARIGEGLPHPPVGSCSRSCRKPFNPENLGPFRYTDPQGFLGYHRSVGERRTVVFLSSHPTETSALRALRALR